MLFRTSRTHRHKRLKRTLMGAFLLVSLIPLTATALFFLHSHSRDLQEQSHSYLQSVRDTKHQQLIDYFSAKESYVMGFVRSELAYASGGKFYGLINAFHNLGADIDQTRINAQQRYIEGSGDQIKTLELKESANYTGSERYRLIHKRYHWAYVELLKRSDFDDILLVDRDGNVAYSTNKLDNFGTNLNTGKYRHSNLGKTFQALKKALDETENVDYTPVVASDFFREHGKAYAWFAAPIIQHGYLHSYAMLRLPITGMSRIISNNTGNAAITTMLVSENLQPLSLHITSAQIQTSRDVLLRALQEQTDVGSYTNTENERVIAAYTPVRINQQKWALVTEIAEDEAYAHIQQLKKIFVIAMVIAGALVIMASHFLSNFITAPLLKLTWAAEKVSAGDLDTNITSTERKDEIGRLAVSFERMQRSIRDKITTIGAQNEELEKSLKLIQKQNDDLQLADKLKDDFLATTSHELRTPLHGMIGIAEALASGDNGPISTDQKYQLDIIMTSGQRLATLVDDLLDYHKMRYGNLDIEKSAVDLAVATSMVLELSGHLLRNKAIRIINQVPVGLPRISADPQRLEQVLYNLIGNAIKYTEEGKIVISATVLDEKIRVQVVDTGQGIPAEYLEHIFEPLTQAHQDAKRYRQGAGLGLSVSRQLIELMGGILYVSSQPQVGTTFSFNLPLASEKEISLTQARPDSSHFQIPVQGNSEPPETDAFPENTDGPLIIIADDEPVNLQLINNYLRLRGYRTKTVNNGNDTLKLVEAEQPDLLLLDIMMPGANGYEVCESLRTRYDHAELPIIMLTALCQAEDRIRGFEAGANDYLTKPFHKRELEARIDAHLMASQAERKRQENNRLQQELKQREVIESDLLETQQRLLEQLEFAHEAIICVRQDQRIRYVNEAATRLFKRSEEQLKRSGIDEIIAPKYLKQTQEHFCGTIDIVVGDRYEQISADILKLPENAGFDTMYIFNMDSSMTTTRIHHLETAVDALSSFAFEGDKTKLERLKELGDEFAHITNQISNSTDKQEMMRIILVDTMITALECWEKSTGQNKFDFAEQSGLWRVYLDRCTLQTRTLDKYLQLETLPKSPRWRTVLKSADFILTHCSGESNHKDKLNRLRDKLQKMLTS